VEKLSTFYKARNTTGLLSVPRGHLIHLSHRSTAKLSHFSKVLTMAYTLYKDCGAHYAYRKMVRQSKLVNILEPLFLQLF
jgi:hypothetical protein